MFHQSRGRSEGEWESSRRALEERGLLVGGGTLAVGHGVAGVDRIGALDDLAGAPLGALDVGELMAMTRALVVLADQIVGSGVIPFPNPIGLPGPGSGRPAEPG